MNARRKQGFIHVYVAHSGQESLIQQQRFYLSLAAPQTRAELFEADLERLRSQPCHAFAAPFNPAELARVFVQQNAFIECKNAVRVLALFAVHQKLAGHAEVYRERACLERDYDELAAPADGLDRLPRQAR